MSAPLNTTALVGVLMGRADSGTLGFFGAYLTAWDAVTLENTVSTGAQEFVNLACINPTLLAVGPVLMLSTPGAPIILGRIYRPTIGG